MSIKWYSYLLKLQATAVYYKVQFIKKVNVQVGKSEKEN